MKRKNAVTTWTNKQTNSGKQERNKKESRKESGVVGEIKFKAKIKLQAAAIALYLTTLNSQKVKVECVLSETQFGDFRSRK